MFATAVGGITTAAVMAAIPDDDGVIHGCYRSSGLLANGQTRIIDDATETCNTNETAISWPSTAASTGPQVAYAAFNPDGTLDEGYSENVVEAKIVSAPNPGTGFPDGYDAACFNVAFEPRIAGNRREASSRLYLPSDRIFLIAPARQSMYKSSLMNGAEKDSTPSSITSLAVL